MGPCSSFSVFPSSISSSGISNLLSQGGDQTGDLSEEFWVLCTRGNLSERVDKRSISCEFVVKMGHIFKSLGNTLDSSLELDKEGTSSHGS